MSVVSVGQSETEDEVGKRGFLFNAKGFRLGVSISSQGVDRLPKLQLSLSTLSESSFPTKVAGGPVLTTSLTGFSSSGGESVNFESKDTGESAFDRRWKGGGDMLRVVHGVPSL